MTPPADFTIRPGAPLEVGRPAEAASADTRTTRPGRRWVWPAVATLAATLPVAGVFTLSRVFYVRDLSFTFWTRHLWLRRSLLAGEWPLWDPYVAGGQSAAADGLHQMFLLPVLALRLLGSEVVGFNLWVALPFPLAALGAYLFFSGRFSSAAAALGAVALAVSGPVASTGNFPNMSWSVAAMPWLFWAVDRCLSRPARRQVALLAAVVGFQALAGEPVTLAASVVAALAFAVVCGGREPVGAGPRGRALAAVALGLVLGGVLSAAQVLPMTTAAAASWRAAPQAQDFWSFHPVALIEAVCPHLFGNYADAVTFDQVPWMVALNSGREPFFSSVYVGPTLVALGVFALVAPSGRRWTLFWMVTLGIALVASLGGHTPIYPAVQAAVPLVRSFRFPVKYLVVCAMALAALAAHGWDAVRALECAPQTPRRLQAARAAGVAVAALLAGGAYAVSLLTFSAPRWTGAWVARAAHAAGVRDVGAAVSFLIPAVPSAMTRLGLVSAGAALLLWVATARRGESRLARGALYGVLVFDLVGTAWGLNPTFDARWLSEPSWTRIVRAHPESRFYFGGQWDGAFDSRDPDTPPAFEPPVDLTPGEVRGTVANEAVQFPAAWGVREVFSHDLAVLWPRVVRQAHARFRRASPEERDRFLARTAVRFRVLPPTSAEGHAPLSRLRYFQTASLYDWGTSLTRAFVVPDVLVVPDLQAQLDALFSVSFDVRRAVMTAVVPSAAAGGAGRPGERGARIVDESANRVVVDACGGESGGYLVLLDSYSPDWEAAVDGGPATIYRANVLYRTVPIGPGHHLVDFRYRPWAVQVGLAFSLAGLLGLGALISRP